MLTVPDLIKLLTTADSADYQQIFATHHTQLQEVSFTSAVAEGLKQAVDARLRQSADEATEINQALFALAEHTGVREQYALALRAAGNLAIFGRNDYQTALEKFGQAADIYYTTLNMLDWAHSQIGAIPCLGYLSRLNEAVTLANQVRPILAEYTQWQALYQLLMNLAVLHVRRGLMPEALQFIEQAETLATQHQLNQFVGDITLNRSIILRYMGQLDQAAQVAQAAETWFLQAQQSIYAAHAQTSRGVAYIAQGRYNEALTLLDRAREAYIAGQCPIDAIWIDLFATDCWLHLGRYRDVLRLSQVARNQFASLGLQRDLAAAIVSEAVAYAALNRYDEAQASFEEAQQLFDSDQNPGDRAICQLEQATVLLRQKRFTEAEQLAQGSYRIFHQSHQLMRAAHAQLLLAQTAYALGRFEPALLLLAAVDIVTDDQMALWLTFQVQALRARILRDSAESPQTALPHFAAAITTLERLRGRLMTEFRADFLQDKESIYGDALMVCLAAGLVEQALDYAERARSRALVDLIAYRLDLRIEPRSKADLALVSRLRQLQNQRNGLYRRWMDGDNPNLANARQDLQQFEQEVTQLWHQLMVRNADYARDAALTEVRSEPIQPYLAADTLMLNFFVHGDQIVVFLISAEKIHLTYIPTSLRRISQLLRQVNLTLKAASVATPTQILNQLPNVKQLLQQLFTYLVHPILDYISHYANLIIVPHGAALHYLPFHALFDGKQYLCQTHTISYLPSASLLHYQKNQATKSSSHTKNIVTYAIGYSNKNALPYASEEAIRIATQTAGISLTESAATIAAVREAGATATILHLSTHGDFNQANPLFSGLSLADGQLATIDIFNLKLQASLVTLSACQTGRSVVSGGDELQGLARAFLYAGASSLLVSLWQVHDRSTLLWMEDFYQHLLAQGETKISAVQSTQNKFIQADGLPAHLAHPWYWAAFFLIGNTETIMP